MNDIQTEYTKAKACYDAALEDVQFRINERYPDPYGLTDEQEEEYHLFIERVESERQMGDAREWLRDAENALLDWAARAVDAQPLKKHQREELRFLFQHVHKHPVARRKVLDLAARWDESS